MTEVRMLRTLMSLLAAVVFLAASASTARAQDMSAAEREVWAWEQACWGTDDLESVMACFHEDYVGWIDGATVPFTKADRRAFFERFFETEEMVFFHLRPVSVTVRNNMAIVLYVSTFTSRNKETNEETTVTDKWTDVVVKDGGSWYYIADHSTTAN